MTRIASKVSTLLIAVSVFCCAGLAAHAQTDFNIKAITWVLNSNYTPNFGMTINATPASKSVTNTVQGAFTFVAANVSASGGTITDLTSYEDGWGRVHVNAFGYTWASDPSMGSKLIPAFVTISATHYKSGAATVGIKVVQYPTGKVLFCSGVYPDGAPQEWIMTAGYLSVF